MCQNRENDGAEGRALSTLPADQGTLLLLRLQHSGLLYWQAEGPRIAERLTNRIPDFNEDGLLPPGLYPTDLDGFRERFAVFDQSDRRLRIFSQFKRLFEDALKIRFISRVIVGGSFVTAKAEPNDFDCILVLDPAIVGTKLRPFEYNVISRRMARRNFGGDVLTALDGSAALDEYLEFFQTTREGERVGIVEIVQ